MPAAVRKFNSISSVSVLYTREWKRKIVYDNRNLSWFSSRSLSKTPIQQRRKWPRTKWYSKFPNREMNISQWSLRMRRSELSSPSGVPSFTALFKKTLCPIMITKMTARTRSLSQGTMPVSGWLRYCSQATEWTKKKKKSRAKQWDITHHCQSLPSEHSH